MESRATTRQLEHCRGCARKHGLYGADVYSVRAYLRVLNHFLASMEMQLSRDEFVTPKL
jgi:hypothetical protein